jgi:hypothetical protein
MPVHVIFERSDGSTIKGLQDCTVPSPATKQLVDINLNHGVVNPGDTTVPQIVNIKTYSWNRDGDPANAITDAGLFLAEYYSSDVTYVPDSGKTFCAGANSSVFGGYIDANGSHSAAGDLANLLGFGDAATGGVEVSVDLGLTYTKFATAVGTLASPISLAATAFDIGATDGELSPGDRATVFTRITIPTGFNDPTDAGVFLFNIGLFYNYTE